MIRESNKKNQGVHQSPELATKHAESVTAEDDVELRIHRKEDE